MATTGYYDFWDRNLTGTWGTADSGQTYTLNGVASQFYTDGYGGIKIASAGEKYGYIDLQTSDVDITAAIAMNQAPVTNLVTAGYVAKLVNTSNYYVGSIMVQPGGAISLRFSKVIAGGLTTITTVATGLTMSPFTDMNFRFVIYWSEPLQTNVLLSKVWLTGGEPGGWMAGAFDASLTKYTAGTKVGFHGRDESSVVGVQEVYTNNTQVRSYGFEMPGVNDPMCYDPAVSFPKQTVVQTLAEQVDAAMTTIDPLVTLAGLFPRVRVSNTNVAMTSAPVFSATEFNVGTPTNLGYDSQGIYLGVGIWMVMFELHLNVAASDYILVSFGENDSSVSGQVFADMRSNPSHTGDNGIGGTIHISKMAVVTDPVTPAKFSIGFSPNAGSYTASYMALSAIKISDYFA